MTKSGLISFGGSASEPESGSGQLNLQEHVIVGSVIELEAKYRSPGNEKVEGSLSTLGAGRVSQERMEDVYFSRPKKAVADTDEVLRLRKSDSYSEVTYKGPRMMRGQIKAREEITVGVSDPLALQRILERLGYEESLIIRKKRSTYVLGKVKVEVDDVEGLGEFVELEMLSECPEGAQELLEKARGELGLTTPEKMTYAELVTQEKTAKK